MPRTLAQQQAAQRDGAWCLWALYRCGALIPATDVHHLARRQPRADIPELCVSLSAQYHAQHHHGLEPTTSQLLDLMLEVHGLDLRLNFPHYFAQR